MKIEELSVGNYILHKKTREILQITEILSWGVNVKEYDDATADSIDILPVPLTVEILEKNGFEMADDTYTRPTVSYFSKDRRVQVCNLTNSGDGYWCVHVDNECFETIGSCDVRYVHEMQHLLRLCKYELDLKI